LAFAANPQAFLCRGATRQFSRAEFLQLRDGRGYGWIRVRSRGRVIEIQQCGLDLLPTLKSILGSLFQQLLDYGG
jgi:hypothetical protein